MGPPPCPPPGGGLEGGTCTGFRVLSTGYCLMKIAVIASEVAPFSKTGGLGDVLGALPRRLARDEEVLVLSPLYKSVRRHPLEPLPQSVDVKIRSAVKTASFQAAAVAGRTLQNV